MLTMKTKTRFSASGMLSLGLCLGLCPGLWGCDGGADDGTGLGTGNDGPAPSKTLIDDMEDPEKGPSIIPSSGRVGVWYTFNDETPDGIQTPAADAFEPDVLEVPREGSQYAARTTGSGFTDWGAGFGFDLKNDGLSKLPYDASGFQGIKFWAIAGDYSTTQVWVGFSDINTDPEGGNCKECNDFFGLEIALKAGEWTEHTLYFADTAQREFGDPVEAGLDASTLFAIQFTFEAGETFDVWIDDVEFIE